MDSLQIENKAYEIIQLLSKATGGVSQISPIMFVHSVEGRVRNSGLSKENALLILKEINRQICEQFRVNEEQNLHTLTDLVSTLY